MLLLSSDLPLLIKFIMDKSNTVVEVKTVELANLKALAELGRFVENLAFSADVKKVRQNIHKILTMHLLLDDHTIPEADEVEDVLMLCEFLDNIDK